MPDDFVPRSAMVIAALRQHASQMGDWDPTEMIQAWNSQAGQEKALPYAETFRVVILERKEVKAENG